MIFLGSLYQFFKIHLQSRINHFPLIELIFYSLDKTILYLIIILGIRWIWRMIRHEKFSIKHEITVFLFTFYLLMLLFLTVFREAYYPWQIQLHLHRPLDQINLTPLVETFKLTRGLSKLDFVYNLFGNILWFMPFGIGYPVLSEKNRSFFRTTLMGLSLSVGIEAMQFLLYTGVSDIDDVIFNTLGAMIGYGFYRGMHHKK